MAIIKFRSERYPHGAIGVLDTAGVHYCCATLADLLRLDSPEIERRVRDTDRSAPEPVQDVRRLAPLDPLTEVWAAGVTYERSREARIEESASSDVYSRVYDAQRPELFFKSIGWRVVTDGQPIAIRQDSPLNVPEAELALVVNSAGAVVGYLAANDVSSRSIEGENPLYLPQAKIYAGACALSDGITPASQVADPHDLRIRCSISRSIDHSEQIVWSGETSTRKLRRTLAELVAALFAELDFPHGVILLTGTGLVPDLDTTLLPGDRVAIDIAGVGKLSNPVVSGKTAAGLP